MLRYLDEVVRAGTIRKAAGKLNVASTAINRRIIALENELGQPIFERMPRRLRLTASGEILIEHVRETLKNYERTMQRMTALRGSQRGNVSVATTLGLAAGPMARIINDHLEANPRVQVSVKASLSEAIINSVLSGEVELGLGFNIAPKAGLKTVFAIDVLLGVVVSPSHPLADRGAIRLSDIVGYPLVLAEKTMALRAAVDLALSRFSGMPQPIVETNSIEMMRNIVKGASAITFLNPFDCAADVEAGTLVFLKLAEENFQPQTLQLVARTHDPLDSATSRFVQHLRTALSAMA
jgi:DNA-binding transcriptional LysR family regulator